MSDKEKKSKKPSKKKGNPTTNPPSELVEYSFFLRKDLSQRERKRDYQHDTV
jgi:hypothetical protein